MKMRIKELVGQLQHKLAEKREVKSYSAASTSLVELDFVHVIG